MCGGGGRGCVTPADRSLPLLVLEAILPGHVCRTSWAIALATPPSEGILSDIGDFSTTIVASPHLLRDSYAHRIGAKMANVRKYPLYLYGVLTGSRHVIQLRDLDLLTIGFAGL